MNALTRSFTRLAVRPAGAATKSSRTFTTLSPHRPTVLPSAITTRLPTSFTPSAGAGADLVPTAAITRHPALQAIRCGPRNTMNGATRMVQKRRSGFLVRKRSRTGRKILLRRRMKGRREIAQ
ncbi:hypothetical protein ACRE_076020 [Hapsidospora chrysogenum ATCC 11550]|uniref:Uncharacterized protein n=1 Tax=Hapsidospora chrysogenum (strain ATCC 11550 / CBS 779.69 / DSM 880 / IAM 14645 / JCM 23072 / IMI 49137) TaxID=857340 RepID=A0A086SX48_HAPC1|nr:hypothetical protein ACRE_076020 [Hapsidospora chrysogenum ATCC 11550]